MITLHILDRTGHTELRASDDATQPPIDGLMSIAEMERAFNAHKDLGYMAYADRGPAQGEVMQRFDPNESHITMTPPLAGG